MTRSASQPAPQALPATLAESAGSSAARDIASYLDLFASQISACSKDSEEPVSALAQCVLSIAANVSAILETARTAPATPAPVRAAVERHCAAVLERVQRAVVAFQFHDLLAQRLQHVHEGLAEVASTLRTSQAPQSDAWRAVGERIRARYSLHEQLALFDQHVTGITTAGVSPAEATPSGSRRVEIF